MAVIKLAYCKKCKDKTIYFRVEKKRFGKLFIYECVRCGYRFTKKVYR